MTPDRDDVLGFVTRSLLDDRVWVCHIPDTDIATGENHAGALWAARARIEQFYGPAQPGVWERGGRDLWVYREES